MYRFAILRIEKRSLDQASAMAQHALRNGPTVPNADASRSPLNRVIVGPRRAEEVMDSIRAALPAARRRDAVLVVEVLVTFSPEVTHEWSEAKQHEYLADGLHWVAKHFGGIANVKSAVVHLDETTPHLQILLVPLQDGSLRANHFIGGPAGLRRMQTAFAEDVGVKYGLARGLERKAGMQRISHQHVSRFYASISAERVIEAIAPMVSMPRIAPPPTRDTCADEPSWGRAQSDWSRAAAQTQLRRTEALEANKRHYEGLKHWAAVGLRYAKFNGREMERRLHNTSLALASLQEEADRVRADTTEAVSVRDRLLGVVAELEAYLATLTEERDALAEAISMAPAS